MHRESIVFDPLFEDVAAPVRSTDGSAGYDVRAYMRGRTLRVMLAGSRIETKLTVSNSLTMGPGDRAIIPLGFRAQLPLGVEAQVRLRSSVAFRTGLIVPNAPATIDPDYPDEWLVLLANLTSAEDQIEHNERFAQIIISRFIAGSWERGKVSRTTNREGGLGSTGE